MGFLYALGSGKTVRCDTAEDVLALARAEASLKDAVVSHRDVNPGNVLVSDAAPVVADLAAPGSPEMKLLAQLATGEAIDSQGLMSALGVKGGRGLERGVIAWAGRCGIKGSAKTTRDLFDVARLGTKRGWKMNTATQARAREVMGDA